MTIVLFIIGIGVLIFVALMITNKNLRNSLFSRSGLGLCIFGYRYRVVLCKCKEENKDLIRRRVIIWTTIKFKNPVNQGDAIAVDYHPMIKKMLKKKELPSWFNQYRGRPWKVKEVCHVPYRWHPLSLISLYPEDKDTDTLSDSE